jgi:Carboxypeptidase regulatory-like domain
MSHHYLRRAVVMLSLAGALLAVACGGDTPASPSPTPTVSPAPSPAPTPAPAPAPPPPAAPVAISLSGTVLTPSGAPIAGATVTILDGSNGGRSTTASGAGAYRFDGLQSSNGNVSAKAAGYQESVRGMYIDGAATLNFTLQPTPAPATFSGVWRGRGVSSSCKDDGAAAGFCRVFGDINDNLVMVLTQNANDVTGTVDFGGFPLKATGTAQGDRLQINGTGTYEGTEYEYKNWNTPMSGSTMTGGFTLLEYLKSGGSVQYTIQLVNVTRTSVTTASH